MKANTPSVHHNIRYINDLPQWSRRLLYQLYFLYLDKKENGKKFYDFLISLKGSMVYQNNIAHLPAHDLDIEIEAEGFLKASPLEIAQWFFGLVGHDQHKVRFNHDKSCFQCEGSEFSLKVYHDKTLNVFNVNIDSDRVNITIYDKALLPKKHLRWNSSIDALRLVLQNNNQYEFVLDFVDAFKSYIGRELYTLFLDNIKNQTDALVINKKSKFLIHRLCLLTVKGVRTVDDIKHALEAENVIIQDMIAREFKLSYLINPQLYPDILLKQLRSFGKDHGMNDENLIAFIETMLSLNHAHISDRTIVETQKMYAAFSSLQLAKERMMHTDNIAKENSEDIDNALRMMNIIEEIDDISAEISDIHHASQFAMHDNERLSDLKIRRKKLIQSLEEILGEDLLIEDEDIHFLESNNHHVFDITSILQGSFKYVGLINSASLDTSNPQKSRHTKKKKDKQQPIETLSTHTRAILKENNSPTQKQDPFINTMEGHIKHHKHLYLKKMMRNITSRSDKEALKLTLLKTAHTSQNAYAFHLIFLYFGYQIGDKDHIPSISNDFNHVIDARLRYITSAKNDIDFVPEATAIFSDFPSLMKEGLFTGKNIFYRLNYYDNVANHHLNKYKKNCHSLFCELFKIAHNNGMDLLNKEDSPVVKIYSHISSLNLINDHGDKEKLKILIKHGLNLVVAQGIIEGWLQNLKSDSHIEWIDDFIALGVNIDQKSPTHTTNQIVARSLSSQGASELLQKTLQCGDMALSPQFKSQIIPPILTNNPSLVHHQYPDDMTIFLICCQAFHPALAKFFLSQGADINVCDHNGNSALHYLVIYAEKNPEKYSEVISLFRYLITQKIHVDKADIYDSTAFVHSIVIGFFDIAKLLIDNGANPNQKAQMFETHQSTLRYLLALAPQGDKDQFILFMIEKTSLNIKYPGYWKEMYQDLENLDSHLGRRLLNIIVQKYRTDEVKLQFFTEILPQKMSQTLINYFQKNDIVLSKTNRNNEQHCDVSFNKTISQHLYQLLSAVNTAITTGSDETLIASLQQGTKCDLTNSSGISPLLYAVGKNNIHIVRTLLDYGANPSMANPNQISQTPLRIALKPNSDPNIASILIEHAMSHEHFEADMLQSVKSIFKETGPEKNQLKTIIKSLNIETRQKLINMKPEPSSRTTYPTHERSKTAPLEKQN